MGLAAGIGLSAAIAGVVLLAVAVWQRQPVLRDCGLLGVFLGVIGLAIGAEPSTRAWVVAVAPLLALTTEVSRLLVDCRHHDAIHVEPAAWRSVAVATAPPVLTTLAAAVLVAVAVPAGTVPSGLLPAAMWVPVAGGAALAVALHRLGRRRVVVRRASLVLPVVLVVLVGVAVLTALGAEARDVSGGGDPAPPATASTAPPAPAETAEEAAAGAGGLDEPGAPAAVRWLLALVGLAGVVAAIVVLGQREQLVPPEDLVPDPVVRERLVASGRAPAGTDTMDRAATIGAVDDALVQLRAGMEPRVAVRIAYDTVAHGLGRQALARQPTETEGDYLGRILGRWGTGAGSADLARLTELFSRARFSSEPIDEAMRREAIAAFGRLRHELDGDDDGGAAMRWAGPTGHGDGR
jgi:hypothetical protein